jgi:small conductance mechanosensitive channel
MDLEKILDKLMNMAVEYGPKLLGAVIVLIIGSWIIKMIMKSFTKILNKQKIDDSLKPFLRSIFGILLRVMLVISVLSMVGIQMTSFIAILGAAGLAVGMALSGTLQNFAGGVMILLFKPFRVGDLLEAKGYKGIVQEIQIFNTILKTPDNRTIIIPNGGLSNSSMVNFSNDDMTMVEWTFGIAYGDSAEKAMEVLKQLVAEDTRLLTEPDPPAIVLSSLGDSSVNITVRTWVKIADYWGAYFDMNKKVYNTFAKEGLSIPFPQMDVHLHKNN